MTAQLSPVPVFKAFGNDGEPLAGGFLYTYAAGTSTPQATYIDSTQTTQNTNPIILNARGEASVWLDISLTYKLFLTDSVGNTIPGWPVDNVVGGYLTLSFLNSLLTSNYLGAILFPQTAAELAAAITPTNYAYPAGVVDRYGTNAFPGTTDMTAAIKASVSQMAQSGAAVQFLASTYLVTSTPMTFTNAMNGIVNVRGVPFKSIIVNQSVANNPTILIAGCEYFMIQGLVLVGKATFPNHAIWTMKDGSANASGAGIIRDIYMTPNGGGIWLRSTYEVTVDQCFYWPTGDPAPSYGGTIDNNAQSFGIWGDSSDGGQVNAIIIRDFRTSGLNTIAADSTAASIKIDGTNGSGTTMVGWRIDGLIMERIGCRALWCRQANTLTADNLWVENAEIRIDNNSRRCHFRSIEGGNTATIVADGTQALGGNAYLTFENCAALSFTADSANQLFTFFGENIWGASGFSNSSTASIYLGNNISSATPAQLTLENAGSVGTPFAVLNGSATTGAHTATFTATNKPGSGTTAPTAWLPVSLDGTTYYIPCWT